MISKFETLQIHCKKLYSFVDCDHCKNELTNANVWVLNILQRSSTIVDPYTIKLAEFDFFIHSWIVLEWMLRYMLEEIKKFINHDSSKFIDVIEKYLNYTDLVQVANVPRWIKKWDDPLVFAKTVNKKKREEFQILIDIFSHKNAKINWTRVYSDNDMINIAIVQKLRNKVHIDTKNKNKPKPIKMSMGNCVELISSITEKTRKSVLSLTAGKR